MGDRLHTGLVVAVLLLVGALLGSVMLEWGNRSGGSELGADRPPLSRSAGHDVEGERVSVEVLNGAGDRGAAERFSERLRDLGFDVKTYGNARSFDQAATEIIDRSERPGAAEAISDALGGVPVRVDPAPQLYLDATLVLGDDWREVLERMSP